MSDEGVWTEVLYGPRWAGIPEFIRNECWLRKLKLQMEVDTGWVRETVRVRVTGPKNAVTNLSRDVYAAMISYSDEQRAHEPG